MKETEKQLNQSKFKSYNDITDHPYFLVNFSTKINENVRQLKRFLYDNFYTSEFVYRNRSEAEKILVFIIKFLENNTSELPDSWFRKITNEHSKKQTIVDYVCGMTDQYAINFYYNYAP